MKMTTLKSSGSSGKCKGLCLIALLALFCTFGVCVDVWADGEGYEGYGAGGGGVTTGCNTYPHAIRVWCGGDSGGASWHIYKVDYPPNGGGPIYDKSLVFLRDGGYDERLPDSCANIGADYYIAYAFDGRKGVGGPFATYGPIHHPYYFPKSGLSPEYNGYKEGTAKDWATVLGYIESGTNVNAWRISETAATEAYREAGLGSTINERIGYFCAPKTKKVTLSGVAINLTTRKPIGQKNPKPADVIVGQPASITAEDIPGYDFAFWSTDTPDKQNPTEKGKDKKYTMNKVEENVTMYAYYKPQKTDFLGRSNVSLRSSSYATDAPNDYVASEINPIGLGVSRADVSNSRNICIGQGTTTNITFSHSVFSSADNKATTAQVVNNFSLVGDGYVMKNAGNSSQSSNFDQTKYDVKTFSSMQNPVYWDLFRNDGTRYSDESSGGWKYFHRDFAEVQFSKKGTYNFCETLKINGVSVSESCAHITVTDKNCGKPTDPTPPAPSDCGSWTPSSFTGSDSESGTTSVVSKVRNNDVGTMDHWDDSVYAKPKDNVEWIHCYYPGVQEAAFTSVTTNNYHPHPDYDNKLSYSDFSSFGVWQNKYTISTSATNHNRTAGFRTPKVPGSVTEYREIGDATAVMFNDDSYSVEYKREGDNLIETNTPGSPVKVEVEHHSCSWSCNCTTCCSGEGKNKTCTTCCDTCSHDSPGYIGSERTESSSMYASSATVKVPYNFENRVSGVSQVNGNDESIVYAGEEATFTFTINTDPRYNDITKGEYATKVPDAAWWLSVRTDEYGTQDTTPDHSALNIQSNPGGSSLSPQVSINVPDIEAGSKVCVRANVTPSASNGDDDMIGSDGNTIDSPERCFTVAKRPSLEVWGGNVYSSGLISTSVADKKHLAKFPAYPYRVEGNAYGHFLYGSWNDSGIISSGGVSGFSSGATLGGLDLYGSVFPNPLSEHDNNDPLVENPGGGKDTRSLCRQRSPLTFSNDCGEIGAIGDNEMVAGSIQGDKTLITSKFVYEDSVRLDAINGQVRLGDESQAKKYADDGVLYYYGSKNNLKVSGYEMNDNLVRVVHTIGNGDITIEGDLKYGGLYGTYNEMPKLVIYAGGNIKINCAVKRIDAVLMAEGKVITCANANSSQDRLPAGKGTNKTQNDKKRSNQLIINGAVIAGELEPGRTYGAAAGANSIVPAEIISFDPSLYLWSSNSKGRIENGAGSGKDTVIEDARGLNVTYQKEIAPRI